MKKKMTCADSNCGYYWQEADEDYPRCHFEGWGKAPCEYDDEPIEKEDKEWDCSRCFHHYSGSADSASCCACCECGEYFDEIEDRYTYDDLGNNWW